MTCELFHAIYLGAKRAYWRSPAAMLQTEDSLVHSAENLHISRKVLYLVLRQGKATGIARPLEALATCDDACDAG